MGLVWVSRRVKFAARGRLGIMQRRLPMCRWSQRPLAAFLRDGVPSDPVQYRRLRQNSAGRFFFQTLPSADRLASISEAQAVAQADALLRGTWIYFGAIPVKAGFPPNWHRNPLTGEPAPSNRHWADLDDFAFGDIKLVWEASRFSPVYALVRAYGLTGNEEYPKAFWSLVEHWAQHNPPQAGLNWKCGQEAAFRLMVWCFGLHAFLHSPQSTPERVGNLAAMIAVTATRIEANIDYALSQNNNHGISEATGLFTVGTLFPEFRQAESWVARGRDLLESQARTQIYDDGAYVQHSMNYHRVMLHDYIWAARLAEISDAPFSEALYARLLRSTEFLDALTDLVSGQAPNYGNNDGAQVLPLTDCEYADFRPVLQASYYLCSRQRRFAAGPWDEALIWLFGESALTSPMRPNKQPAIGSSSGYYLLRGRESWAMIRCAEYRDRPAHADQLHLDLWWRGLNVAIDGGTFQYNAPPPWDAAFSGSAAHNTITVDGQDQMRRFSRFLWIEWAKGREMKHKKSGDSELWAGEHDGYRGVGVRHRRTVERAADAWTVVDEVLGTGDHRACLHWTFSDFPCDFDLEARTIRLNTPEGLVQIRTKSDRHAQLSLVRAGEILAGAGVAENVAARGWVSGKYASKVPALSLAFEVSGSLPVSFSTTFEFISKTNVSRDLELLHTDLRV
jgi:asparagine synthase (glutamine-hydrolysing)